MCREYSLFLPEFGQRQDVSLYNNAFNNCLRKFTMEHNAGWAQWSVAGSYMVRQVAQNSEDTWSLKAHDWSGWPDPLKIESFWKKWIEDMGRIGLGSRAGGRLECVVLRYGSRGKEDNEEGQDLCGYRSKLDAQSDGRFDSCC